MTSTILTELLRTSLAGALFGAALATSGVYLPSAIISQMYLANFHMLKVFLAASATSSFVLATFNAIGLSKTIPRSHSSLGLFGHYDGNILGGCMIGLGMTLTGACPGTVLVQIANGIYSGWYVMAGGVLAGMVYTRISSGSRQSETRTLLITDVTLYGKLGIDKHYAVLMYGLVCSAVISLVTALGPKQAPTALNPLLGGALIGIAQAASLILTGAPVGVSTGYEVLGSHLWRAFGSLFGHVPSKPLTSTRSVYFGAGIIMGGCLFAVSITSRDVEAGANISPGRGILGGFIMVLGARLAGGCTSGHGISGMSLLSISSSITVASMFFGGFSAALLL